MEYADKTRMALKPIPEHGLSDIQVNATSGEAIHDILTAMHRLRLDLRDIGGVALVSSADDAIRDRLSIRMLQYAAAMGGGGERVPSEVGALGVIAERMMLSAAETCAFHATKTPAARGMFYVLLILLDRLAESWGCPLDGDQLIEWLDCDMSGDLVSAVWTDVEGRALTLGAIERSRSQSRQSRQSSAR